MSIEEIKLRIFRQVDAPLSEFELDKTLNYLLEKWNVKVVKGFLVSIENLIKQISNNPKQFFVANKKNKIRKCVV